MKKQTLFQIVKYIRASSGYDVRKLQRISKQKQLFLLSLFAYEAKEKGYTVAEIAAYLKKSEGMIYYALKKHELNIEKNHWIELNSAGIVF